MDPSETLKWLHHEMVRIESHWTDQLQNQQRRIGAVLAVNGFLLAFLAAAGLGVDTQDSAKGWYLYPFYLSLLLLSIALIFGMIVLIPHVPIGGNESESESESDPEQAVSDAQSSAGEIQNLEESRREPNKAWQKDEPWTKTRRWLYATYGRPRLKPPSSWLDSKKIFDDTEKSLKDESATLTPSEGVVLEVARSAGENQKWNHDLQWTNERRRRWLNWEMTFILFGILSLIVTVAGVAQHKVL
jgi:hypothetical protein